MDGDNVLSSKNIIALARVDNTQHVNPPGTDLNNVEYTPFSVKFDYEDKATPFNEEEARAYKYNLTVVFTSSVRGAEFVGAIGSVLYVDEVEVVCE